MSRNFLIIFISFFILACQAPQNVYYPYVSIQENKLDEALLKAYNLEQMGQLLEARAIFLELFKDYNSSNLLENAFAITLANNLDKKDDLYELSQPFLEQNPQLKRLSVLYLLQKNDFVKASLILEELLQKEDEASDYDLLGDIYLQMKETQKASINYEKAYAQEPSENLALKLAQIYKINKSPKKAKTLLEDFKKEQDCTLKTCLMLAQIYSDEKNYKALKELYFELYKIQNDKNFILAIVEILQFEKNEKEALKIALEYELNDDIIIFLYQKQGLYKEAARLSLELYEKNKEQKRYLLQAAIFEFELAMKSKKIDKKVLDSVAKKFEAGLDTQSEALFLNYYGYLLIDYDMDIAKGIELVQRALNQDIDNNFYLDSLAWGYYKQGKCTEAWDILKQTFYDKEFTNSAESQSHIKAIKQCLGQKR